MSESCQTIFYYNANMSVPTDMNHIAISVTIIEDYNWQNTTRADKY